MSNLCFKFVHVSLNLEQMAKASELTHTLFKITFLALRKLAFLTKWLQMFVVAIW